MDFLQNHVLTTCLAAWAIAQVLKVLIGVLKEHHLDLSQLLSPGGMPSAHSALVTALTTEIGLREGVQSTVFAFSVVLAAIVMYDAAGIRQAVSIQARLLNKLIDDLFQHQEWNEGRLREILGHTRIEVIGGLLLGLALALIWN